MSYVHDEMTERIIGCAMTVHIALGPGFVEQTYEAALCIELAEHQIGFERQMVVPITYKDRKAGEYRPDLVVENRVVVEISRPHVLTASPESYVVSERPSL